MVVLRRVRLLIGAAAAVGLIVFALHATAQAPTPGQYISWAPRATATATSGPGPALPMASAPPLTDSGPLGGLTIPLAGVLKELNLNTAETATGQFAILKDLENALAARISEFLTWVTGGR
jgi:hypothetical protein